MKLMRHVGHTCMVWPASLFLRFLNDTPALRDYASKMWLRHEDALAAAIAEELGISQMHVSRLLSRTLADLRRKLEEQQPA